MGLNYKVKPITDMEPYLPSVNKGQMQQELALQEKVVEWENKKTQDNLKGIMDLREKVNSIRVFPEFAKDVDEGLAGYANQINQITETLNNSPEKFARMGGDIRALAMNFSNDFVSGKYAGITKGYNDFATAYTKDKNNDKLDPYLVSSAYSKAKEQYVEELKTNPNAQFSAPSIPEVPDMVEAFSNVSKMAKTKKVYDPATGTTTEVVDPNELQNAKKLVMDQYAPQLAQLKALSPEYYDSVVGNLDSMVDAYGKSATIVSQKDLDGGTSGSKSGKGAAGEQAALTHSDLSQRKVISPYVEMSKEKHELAQLQKSYNRSFKANGVADIETQNKMKYLKSQIENKERFHKVASDEAYKAMGKDAERLKVYAAKAAEEGDDLITYKSRLKKMAESLPNFKGANKQDTVPDRLKRHNELKASYAELSSLMNQWNTNYKRITSEMQNNGERIGNPEVAINNSEKLNNVAITAALQSGFVNVNGKRIEGAEITEEDLDNLNIHKISFENNKISMYVTGTINGQSYKNSKILIDNPDSIQHIGQSLASNKSTNVASFGQLISSPAARSLYSQIQNTPNGKLNKKSGVSEVGPPQTINYGSVQATIKKVIVNGKDKLIVESMTKDGEPLEINDEVPLSDGTKAGTYISPDKLQDLIIKINAS